MARFNGARFQLRHYAHGYYPTTPAAPEAMPVNRLFFPLENPNGTANFIEDAFRRYPLVPGRMYFVPAFLPVRFRLDNQLLFLSIQTSLEIFPGVELFSGCSRMLELPSPPEFGELAELVNSAPEDRYRIALRAGSLAFAAQTAMLAHYPQSEFWKPLALRKYTTLTAYLEQYGTARTSVSDLAALEHGSRESFTRRFMACTGITPKQLIDRFVTGRCLTLLGRDCTLKEIAETLRFRDEFAFSRYFKRNMGESPRAWRRRNGSHPAG